MLGRINKVLICLGMICLPLGQVCLGAPVAVHNVGTLSYQSDEGRKCATVSNTVSTPIPPAEISLITPASGSIGTIVTINGQGFMASETVRIDFGQSSTVAVVTTISAGTFATSFTTTPQPLGTMTVTAGGINSGLQAKAFFILTRGFLDHIHITPPTAALNLNTSQQFVAVGHDVNEDTLSIIPNWSVAGDIGTITPPGTFTATKMGTGTVVATVGSITARATVTVIPLLTAPLLINEVAFKETANDWIELKVMQTGKYDGYKVYKNATSFVSIPAWGTLTSGEFIVIHEGTGTADSANKSENNPGYWDIYGLGYLTDTDAIIQIKTPTGERVDVVIWSNNNGSFTASKTEANAAVSEGHWDAGATVTTSDSDAWIDSDEVIPGRSIGRDMLSTDTNSKSDWYLLLLQTPGGTNTPILEHILITPATATVLAGQAQRFIAQAYSQDGYLIPGLVFNWAVSGGIGRLTVSTGAATTFIAGTSTGAGSVTVTYDSKQGWADVNVVLPTAGIYTLLITDSTKDSQLHTGSSTVVDVPANTFSNPWMQIIVNDTPEPDGYSLADSAAQLDRRIRIPQALKKVVRQIKAVDTGGEQIGTMTQPVKLTLSYPASIGSRTALRLRIYRLNTTDNFWGLVSGRQVVNLASCTVTVWLTHFSHFRLGESPQETGTGATTVNPQAVNREGTGTTTISTIFYDADSPAIGSLTITFKVKSPGGTETILVDNKRHGETGLAITGGEGTYTAGYIWDPTDTQPLGLYDLYFSVSDGIGSLTDGYENNPDELEIFTTPPGTITNLSIATITATSVTLTWTAPEDDGYAGTATSYDIRYATFTITEDSWPLATPCSGAPTPGTAGGIATSTVSGLQPETTYYFAIKTADEAVNVSALSNVASATTKAGEPMITLTKTVSPTGSHCIGTTLTYTLTYKNIGSGTAKSIEIVDMVPAGTLYGTGTASGAGCTITYSHGGGVNFDSSDAAPVTHIRWERSDLAVGAGGTVSFKVTIQP